MNRGARSLILAFTMVSVAGFALVGCKKQTPGPATRARIPIGACVQIRAGAQA
jgi:hypothetical protein